MNDYISREATVKAFCEKCKGYYDGHCIHRGECDIDVIQTAPAADVQEKKYCKMIPLELDSRGCTNVFRCTNCHQYIYLGFIQKEYSGSYCSECGAEVERSIKIPNDAEVIGNIYDNPELIGGESDD